MESLRGRYCIAYNGEAYNNVELRAELEGRFHFRGTSDTEVVLNGCIAWGVGGLLERLNGMFAFALWDKSRRCLYLARDRFGEKPLYYTTQPGLFLFASELRSLRCHPAFQPSIERDAVAALMHLGYIAAPQTIYSGVYKLRPGFLLTADVQGNTFLEQYWDMVKEALSACAQPARNDAECLEELEQLLTDCVRRRMVADVPVGAFLSGGIDSSLLVSLMCRNIGARVKTFAIGFHEAEWDEAPHARAVANHLETDHTELYVTPQEARDVIPALPDIYDEPFADSSQIPTFLVSRLARQEVAVSLTGDGGDELFAGYSRYQWLLERLHRQERLPNWLQQALRKLPVEPVARGLSVGSRLRRGVPSRPEPPNHGSGPYLFSKAGLRDIIRIEDSQLLLGQQPREGPRRYAFSAHAARRSTEKSCRILAREAAPMALAVSGCLHRWTTASAIPFAKASKPRDESSEGDGSRIP